MVLQGNACVRGVCDVCMQAVTTDHERIRMDDAGMRFRHLECNHKVANARRVDQLDAYTHACAVRAVQ